MSKICFIEQTKNQCIMFIDNKYITFEEKNELNQDILQYFADLYLNLDYQIYLLKHDSLNITKAFKYTKEKTWPEIKEREIPFLLLHYRTNKQSLQIAIERLKQFIYDHKKFTEDEKGKEITKYSDLNKEEKIEIGKIFQYLANFTSQNLTWENYINNKLQLRDLGEI